MAIAEKYQADADVILSHLQDNGGELWTTPDRRLLKGAPFSALESPLFLLELGMSPDDPILKAAADLFFSVWREDGRFQVAPKGGIYPCQTIHAADLLCRLGYASDKRMQKTLRHLLETQYRDGGWRCNKFSYGGGPETESSNPFPTLIALDAFRFTGFLNQEPALEKAAEFLLSHWETRKPLGPCHYGIGTLFMQVEYPFRSYNLFLYVYVLSFYSRAKEDERFWEAFRTLESKTVNGQIIVERVVPKLASLNFCKKGLPSELATAKYQEILRNLKE